MTKNTNANANDSTSQRKRNTNQPRANVASQNNPQSQQNSKRGNKQQNQHQNQNQNQTQTAAKSAPSANTSAPTPTFAPAPVPIPVPTAPATPTIIQPDEPHQSVAGFNSDEVNKLLKSGYDEKAPTYKPDQPVTQQKTSPWGQKRTYSTNILPKTEYWHVIASSMSNGKDFWLELRKQVAILQKGESTNKGG